MGLQGYNSFRFRMSANGQPAHRGRIIGAFFAMFLFLVGLGLSDVLLLTSPAILGRIVGDELRKALGPQTRWDEIFLEPPGTVTIRNLVCEPAGFPPVTVGTLAADLDVLRGTLSAVRLDEVRIRVSPEILSGPKTDTEFPPAGSLPAITVTRCTVEVSLEEVLAPGRPLTLLLRDLFLQSQEGGTFTLQGCLDHGVLGRWWLRATLHDSNLLALADTEGLDLTPELKALFKPEIQRDIDAVKPSGRADVRVEVRRPKGARKPDVRIIVRPRSMEVRHKAFPYPARNIQGELEFDPPGMTIKHAIGELHGGRALLSGRCEDIGPDGPFEFDLRIDGVDLDETLRASLPPHVGGILDALGARGRIAVNGYLRKGSGRSAPTEVPVLLTLLGCRARWEKFPYELEDLTGFVRVEGERVTVHHVEGRSGDARFELAGRLKVPREEDKVEVDLSIRGTNVPLDAKLRAALRGEAAELFEQWTPSGRADVEWTVHARPGEGETHTFRARALGVSLRVPKLPVPVTDLQGTVEGTIAPGRTEVAWSDVRGNCENLVALPVLDSWWNWPWSGAQVRRGQVKMISQGKHVENEGETRLELDLRATGVDFESRLLETLPPELFEFIRKRALLGRGNLRLNLVQKRPEGSEKTSMRFNSEILLSSAGMNMGVDLRQLKGFVWVVGETNPSGELSVDARIDLDSARVAGLLVTRLGGSLSYSRDRLSLSQILGTIYDGTLAGHLSWDLKSDRYEGELRISGMELREMKHDLEGYRRKQLGGRITVGVTKLRGRMGDVKSLTGELRGKISDAHLWEVPIFLRILTLNPGAWGGRQKFEDGEVIGGFENGRLRLDTILFRSEAASIYGRGWIDFDGIVDLKLGVEVIMFWALKPLEWVLNRIQGAILGLHIHGPFENPVGEESNRPK